MARPKKNIKEVVQGKYPEFTDVVDGMGLIELEAMLSKYAKEAEKVSDAMEADEALESAKEEASRLAGPYRDAKKAIRLKSRYLIASIKDKGGDA